MDEVQQSLELSTDQQSWDTNFNVLTNISKGINYTSKNVPHPWDPRRWKRLIEERESITFPDDSTTNYYLGAVLNFQLTKDNTDQEDNNNFIKRRRYSDWGEFHNRIYLFYRWLKEKEPNFIGHINPEDIDVFTRMEKNTVTVDKRERKTPTTPNKSVKKMKPDSTDDKLRIDESVVDSDKPRALLPKLCQLYKTINEEEMELLRKIIHNIQTVRDFFIICCKDELYGAEQDRIIYLCDTIYDLISNWLALREKNRRPSSINILFDYIESLQPFTDKFLDIKVFINSVLSKKYAERPVETVVVAPPPPPPPPPVAKIRKPRKPKIIVKEFEYLDKFSLKQNLIIREQLKFYFTRCCPEYWNELNVTPDTKLLIRYLEKLDESVKKSSESFKSVQNIVQAVPCDFGIPGYEYQERIPPPSYPYCNYGYNFVPRVDSYANYVQPRNGPMFVPGFVQASPVENQNMGTYVPRSRESNLNKQQPIILAGILENSNFGSMETNCNYQSAKNLNQQQSIIVAGMLENSNFNFQSSTNGMSKNFNQQPVVIQNSNTNNLNVVRTMIGPRSTQINCNTNLNTGNFNQQAIVVQNSNTGNGTSNGCNISGSMINSNMRNGTTNNLIVPRSTQINCNTNLNTGNFNQQAIVLQNSNTNNLNVRTMIVPRSTQTNCNTNLNTGNFNQQAIVVQNPNTGNGTSNGCNISGSMINSNMRNGTTNNLIVPRSTQINCNTNLNTGNFNQQAIVLQNSNTGNGTSNGCNISGSMINSNMGNGTTNNLNLRTMIVPRSTQTICNTNLNTGNFNQQAIVVQNSNTGNGTTNNLIVPRSTQTNCNTNLNTGNGVPRNFNQQAIIFQNSNTGNGTTNNLIVPRSTQTNCNTNLNTGNGVLRNFNQQAIVYQNSNTGNGTSNNLIVPRSAQTNCNFQSIPNLNHQPIDHTDTKSNDIVETGTSRNLNNRAMILQHTNTGNVTSNNFNFPSMTNTNNSNLRTTIVLRSTQTNCQFESSTNSNTGNGLSNNFNFQSMTNTNNLNLRTTIVPRITQTISDNLQNVKNLSCRPVIVPGSLQTIDFTDTKSKDIIIENGTSKNLKFQSSQISDNLQNPKNLSPRPIIVPGSLQTIDFTDTKSNNIVDNLNQQTITLSGILQNSTPEKTKIVDLTNETSTDFYQSESFDLQQWEENDKNSKSLESMNNLSNESVIEWDEDNTSNDEQSFYPEEIDSKNLQPIMIVHTNDNFQVDEENDFDTTTTETVVDFNNDFHSPPGNDDQTEEERKEKIFQQFICTRCKKPGTYVCSKCKSTRYCSSRCAALHWKSDHKYACLNDGVYNHPLVSGEMIDL